MNRLYFYRSLITRIRQYLISKSGTNPVTLTNAVEDKLLQGFSITGNSQQSGTPSVESPSPIQTTELKKSSNLLDTDYFNEPKTYNGVTIQYLADEDCFLFNGTATASSPFVDTAFLIQNANNQPFTISAIYVSGNITIPTGAYAVAYIGKQDDSSANHINFMDAKLRQNNTNNTKICDKEYVKDFWFYFTAGVVLENYKVKISVTKLENSFDISKVQTTANITNNGDSLLIAPSGTATTATTSQTLYDICQELEVGDNVIANLTLTNDAGVYNAFSQYRAYIYLTISKRTFVAGSQYTITQDDLNSKIIFYVSPYGSTTITENKSTITNISISKIPTNYEPYGKYGLEIKQEKNILDLYNAHNGQFMTVIEQSENKVVATANNATNNSPVLKLLNKSIPAGNYVLSYTVNIENTPQLQSGAGDRRNEMIIFVGGTFKTKTNSISQDGTYTNSITFTLQSASMVDIRWYRNVVNNVVTEDTTYKVTFTNVQLEQGTEASTYTPYQTPQYNRIWIDKPTLNKNDILTKDKLYVHSKKYLLSDIFDTINGTPLADYITSHNDTWTSGETIHYQDDGLPFNTYVANFSGFCDTIDVYVNNYSSATNTFINISTPVDGYPIVFMDLYNPSATWAKPSDFQSFLLMNDSYLMLYYSGNAEDSFEQSNVSYIDLKPLSAGNNTLTVTNEISPKSCQYKYYSTKEN